MQHFTPHNLPLTPVPVTRPANSFRRSRWLCCQFTRFRNAAVLPPTLALASLLLTCGCGSGGSEAPAATEPTAAQPQAATEQTQATDTANAAPVKPRGRNEVWTDDNGQKWFGNVPMDAFFDQPYEVASNTTATGSAPAADSQPAGEMPAEAIAAATPTAEPAAPTPDTPSTPSTPETPPTTAAADSWDQLIPLTDLDEEIKSIRNFMQETVSSVGNYNSSMTMIPPKVATLAALAEVARKQQESVSWKDDAAYVRNLAKKMNESPLQRGPKDHKRLQELFEGVSDILNRSKPAGLEEPPAEDSFAESAEMRSLMKRMEDAEKTLKTEIGSADALGSRKAMALHEAAILSVLAKIVTEPGYGYGDDAEFKGYGTSIVEAGQSIRAAAEAGDFAGFETAMSKVATTCQNCHSKYKND